MLGNHRVVATMATALVALVASFLIAHRMKSQSVRSSRRPFIARGVEKHFATKGDAGPVKVSYTRFARRSDGSWVEVVTIESPHGETGELTSFWDVASGRQGYLEPFTRSAVTLYLAPGEMRDEINRSVSCPSAVNAITAEHERILRYDVVKITEQYRAPNNGSETIEAWVAPDLDCYHLREFDSRSDGPHNEIEVTDLTEGEPPTDMFDVPPEYVERSPSQLSAEWAARFGEQFWRNESQAKRLDQRYYAHQRR
jgi:hypothetical protein